MDIKPTSEDLEKPASIILHGIHQNKSLVCTIKGKIKTFQIRNLVTMNSTQIFLFLQFTT